MPGTQAASDDEGRRRSWTVLRSALIRHRAVPTSGSGGLWGASPLSAAHWRRRSGLPHPYRPPGASTSSLRWLRLRADTRLPPHPHDQVRSSRRVRRPQWHAYEQPDRLGTPGRPFCDLHLHLAFGNGHSVARLVGVRLVCLASRSLWCSPSSEPQHAGSRSLPRRSSRSPIGSRVHATLGPLPGLGLPCPTVCSCWPRDRSWFPLGRQGARGSASPLALSSGRGWLRRGEHRRIPALGDDVLTSSLPPGSCPSQPMVTAALAQMSRGLRDHLSVTQSATPATGPGRFVADDRRLATYAPADNGQEQGPDERSPGTPMGQPVRSAQASKPQLPPRDTIPSGSVWPLRSTSKRATLRRTS